MNRAAKDALRTAWLNGVRQLRNGQLSDGRGGFCANGVIQWMAGRQHGKDRSVVGGCPECGAMFNALLHPMPIDDEWRLVVHYNNDHGFDFAKIAELMPDDEATA